MNSIRFCLDNILRAGIKLAMLTGVAFTVTACYGVPPEERRYYDNATYQEESQQLEQQLVADKEESE